MSNNPAGAVAGLAGLAFLIVPGLSVVLAASAALDDTGTEIQATESSEGGTRFVIRDSSTDRTPARTAVPIYPRIARRDRIEGEATVCFRINADGRIRSIRVKNYSHRIFRRPALKAIRESSFEPLLPHQVLGTARTCRTYRFRLTPVSTDDAGS